jgi:hypothetical protein
MKLTIRAKRFVNKYGTEAERRTLGVAKTEQHIVAVADLVQSRLADAKRRQMQSRGHDMHV